MLPWEVKQAGVLYETLTLGVPFFPCQALKLAGKESGRGRRAPC